MTLDDPSDLMKQVNEYFVAAGKLAADALRDSQQSQVGSLGEAVARSLAGKGAKKVDPKEYETAADEAEAKADRARDQGSLAAKTARTEADLRAKRAVERAREKAKDVREDGEELAKRLEAEADEIRDIAVVGPPRADLLEQRAKEVRETAREKAAQIEKAGDASAKRLHEDGELAAKAAYEAAEETAKGYDDAADINRDIAEEGRTAQRQAEAAARKRAETQREENRDRPEVADTKQAELDADDAVDTRTAASAARAAAQAKYEDDAIRLTKERDDAARDEWSQEQDAKAAEMQVKREQKVVDDKRTTSERLTKEADAAEAKGDHALADSLRENAARAASDQRIAEARLQSARGEADRQVEASKASKARVEDLEKQYSDVQARRDQAEKAVDGMEERARLLEAAQEKLAEADRSGNDNLRKEAEALVEQAEKVRVDRTALTDANNPPSDIDPPPPAGGESGPVTTPDGGIGPVTTPEGGSGGAKPGGTAPPSGNPTTAELRALTEKYSDAAQALHKRRLDQARTGDPDDHRREVARESAGVDAQLKRATDSRDHAKSQREQFEKDAARLEREANSLDRQGMSALAEEKREEGELAAARAERQATVIKEADAQVSTLQARKEQLDKQWAEEIDQHLGDPKGTELEKTADQMDDATRVMGDAYRASLDADNLRLRAEHAGNEGKADLKAQLEKQAQEAEAKSAQLLKQARRTAPTDEQSQQALKDAGIPVEPPAQAPEAGAPDLPPDAAPVQATPPATSDVVGDDGMADEPQEIAGALAQPAEVPAAPVAQESDPGADPSMDPSPAEQQAAQAQPQMQEFDEPDQTFIHDESVAMSEPPAEQEIETPDDEFAV